MLMWLNKNVWAKIASSNYTVCLFVLLVFVLAYMAMALIGDYSLNMIFLAFEVNFTPNNLNL